MLKVKTTLIKKTKDMLAEGKEYRKTPAALVGCKTKEQC